MKSQIWIAISIYVLVAIIKKRLKRLHNRPLHHITDFESDAIRENTTGSITYGYPLQKCKFQYV